MDRLQQHGALTFYRQGGGSIAVGGAACLPRRRPSN